MTDNEIRIVIAEAYGLPHETAVFLLKNPNALVHHPQVRNYPNDLNAMHEAEKTLTHHQQYNYWFQVMRITPDHTGQFVVIHATARQRAEAFLRTIGKWKD